MAENKLNSVEDHSAREIVISRVFDAPRELVWKLWTEPEHLVQWWGPRGFTTTIHEMDLKPGGVWRLTMHGPDDADYPNYSTFIEVVKPERIVFSHGGGKEGGPDDAQFEATWTFEAEGTKTRLTGRMIFNSAAARDHVVKKYGAIEGGKQTMERLAEHLAEHLATTPAGAEFVISRIFDAPRETVWKAWTECDRLKHWWGPKGFTVISCKIDLRPGGIMHYCLRSPDGSDMWGKFVYRDIVPPERLVFINSFSDEKGGTTRHPMAPTWPREMLSTITFADQSGKTIVIVRWSPFNATEEERKTFEAGMASMQQGWTGTFDQFAEYLAKPSK